ncbi:hypothetical protein PFISCL1PPCAC_14303, partial [Pristionchus fissidentatus]
SGLSGIVSNSVLIYFLIQANFGKAGKLYRFVRIVSAICNIFTSFLVAIEIHASDILKHLCNDCALLSRYQMALMMGGGIVTVLYGPILLLLPDAVTEFLFITLVAQTHAMWELLPAPTVLQYLSLNKSGANSLKRLLYAYVIPYHMLQIIPSDETRHKFEELILKLHGAGPDKCRVYGIPIRSEFAYCAYKVEFFSSTSLLLCSFFQIRVHFQSYGNVVFSRKREQMQRRFFHMQLAQVVLPLLLISLTSICVVLMAATGKDMNNLSIIFIQVYWLFPSAQALLLIGFLTKLQR